VKAPRLICIIGAESTGKTTLAQALASQFNSPWVAEHLREFCDAHGRTPARQEQGLILETQVVHESAALVNAGHSAAPFVFCDTAPLLTAIYSEFVFSDRSLFARAHQLHARYATTLVLQPDIAWVADGVQRDGSQVRAPITEMIERELLAHGHSFHRISGNRLESANLVLHAL
jgi:nicotinamide riboside kinase